MVLGGQRKTRFRQGRTTETRISTHKHIATDQPTRQTLEISEFSRGLLRSDTQGAPAKRCPPDEYDGIVDARSAMQ